MWSWSLANALNLLDTQSKRFRVLIAVGAALVAGFEPHDNCPQCNQGPLKIGVVFD